MNLPSAPEWVERDDVLRFLRRRGLPTTSDQLTRWHKAGLIPRPTRESLGRGRGTRSVYPAIAVWQSHAAAFALRITRSFAEARWMVWYYGFPGLVDLVKRDLIDTLVQYERGFAAALAAFAHDDTNPISDLATARRVSGAWGPVRRRVGRARVETIALVLHEVVLGEFENGAKLDPADYDLIRRALVALDPSASATLAADPKAMHDTLLMLSRELNLPRVRAAVGEAPPELLESIREEAAGLWRAHLVGLPDRWASIPPPEFFLLWLSLRWISPTIAKEMNAAVQLPEFPTPEPSVMAQAVLNRTRANQKRGQQHKNRRSR
jgi:hypothetical protein